jgi:pimeloyl-ACP methyl ester carboxylesterase
MLGRIALPLLAIAGLALGVVPDLLLANQPDKVAPIPAPGIAIPEADRAVLQKDADELAKQIESLRTNLKAEKALLSLLPDVQVFHSAVQAALKHKEFYALNEVGVARTLLKKGFERAAQLRDGRPAWTTQTGLVVRGYVSKIDGSIQPYGLVVPDNYRAGAEKPFRLDFWCHGRDEKLTELRFVDQRLKNKGEFTPTGAFVLHLYGRFCNANHFAGEVDLFEAYASVRQHYPIDENRLVIRGFSMGGAACWQFATHFPGTWAAAAPGAGFAETPEFLNLKKKKVTTPWYEEKLWHLNNCTDYALNLFNCPTIAYSGEIDGQKQAADVMAREMAKEKLKLVHIIGPKTAHKYHPESKVEINKLVDEIVAGGRPVWPKEIRFTTWTLHYNQCRWVQVDQLDEHWARARVLAKILSSKPPNELAIAVETTNVAALTLDLEKKFAGPIEIVIDGQQLIAVRADNKDLTQVHLRKSGAKWQFAASADADYLCKSPGLQGPIDDAFMDRFVMVRPTGQPVNEKVGKWVSAEMAHAIDHWRRQFRGETPVKDDTEISDADIASSNLVLWGDPASNKILARIAAKLPIEWGTDGVALGDKKFAAANHVLAAIYPNPFNPKKYVVLNSGFTFREYDYLNNASQVPKLPDYAVIDVNVPMSSRAPGGIATAGFFDETWKLPKK